ncbi:MAG: KilA-N domain-containing protein [Thermomicrobiales bacterium]|nr:KilA-N domain-containing protein [Thermomicrobiales bacterium]
MNVKGTEVAVRLEAEGHYISLTDIARSRDSDHLDDLIRNWLRNRNTIEFLGIWELLHNPEFKPVEFDGFRMRAGLNSFALTPKQWIDATGAVGIVSRPGRYGGTFAHPDIAFEFAAWISVEFKLYLIKEFQRLKEDENHRLSLEWNLNRSLAKINYRIHTDAVKASLLPKEIDPEKAKLTYATEADILNLALFGQTAKQWRNENQAQSGNIRDYASVEQLVVLANLESLNAQLIHEGIERKVRFRVLNQTAIRQMQSLTADIPALGRLKKEGRSSIS